MVELVAFRAKEIYFYFKQRSVFHFGVSFVVDLLLEICMEAS